MKNFDQLKELVLDIEIISAENLPSNMVLNKY